MYPRTSLKNDAVCFDINEPSKPTEMVPVFNMEGMVSRAFVTYDITLRRA